MPDEQKPNPGTVRLSDEIIRFIRMGPRFRGMLKTGDLGAEFSALMLLLPLRAMGPMRVTDLADLKQADPSTISRQVAQLVKAGLARREADPADGRASRLAVTETGLAACERLGAARIALLERALSDWPTDRVDTFAQLFEEFNTSVEALLRTDLDAPPRENL
ncbi:MarR family winged helix-turn-helix transcriptional regulator [Actinoplanes regularis]|uniref:DNA-binding transcriptional regulator, MarR family n=1 Tax=Actinoplanes regularis TaxID=52697 RepID=A0A239BF76_9ACTN|nr:MarR family transcriptional regulator [Actinoplanes regularis]GIE87921.1 putative HTH-type transcriptional regulator YxaD [Actinoplanes regularis]SNS05693.1 DNA-binding transcriptional regulator, MarR family [Actinoplanes regularis]